MVGPTWMRVCLTLGLDCLPTLSQGTALLLPCVSWTAYCSHARGSMIWMIQGCISTSFLSMSPLGLFLTSYSDCLHGTLYPMIVIRLLLPWPADVHNFAFYNYSNYQTNTVCVGRVLRTLQVNSFILLHVTVGKYMRFISDIPLLARDCE